MSSIHQTTTKPVMDQVLKLEDPGFPKEVAVKGFTVPSTKKSIQNLDWLLGEYCQRYKEDGIFSAVCFLHLAAQQIPGMKGSLPPVDKIESVAYPSDSVAMQSVMSSGKVELSSRGIVVRFPRVRKDNQDDPIALNSRVAEELFNTYLEELVHYAQKYQEDLINDGRSPKDDPVPVNPSEYLQSKLFRQFVEENGGKYAVRADAFDFFDTEDIDLTLEGETPQPLAIIYSYIDETDAVMRKLELYQEHGLDLSMLKRSLFEFHADQRYPVISWAIKEGILDRKLAPKEWQERFDKDDYELLSFDELQARVEAYNRYLALEEGPHFIEVEGEWDDFDPDFPVDFNLEDEEF